MERGLCFGDIIEARAATPSAVDSTRTRFLKVVVEHFLAVYAKHSLCTVASLSRRPIKRGRGEQPLGAAHCMATVLYLTTRLTSLPLQDVMASLPLGASSQTTPQVACAQPSESQESTNGGRLLYSQDNEDEALCHVVGPAGEQPPSSSPPPLPSDAVDRQLPHQSTLDIIDEQQQHIHVHQVETTSDILRVLHRYSCSSSHTPSSLPPSSPCLVIIDNLVDVFSHPSLQMPRGAATGPNFIIQDFGRALRAFIANQQEVHQRPCVVLTLNALTAVGSGGASATPSVAAGGSSSVERLRRQLSRRSFGGAGWQASPDVVLIADEVMATQHAVEEDGDDDLPSNGARLSSSSPRSFTLTLMVARGGRNVGDTAII